MKKKLQVFISSTYTDLIEERQVAVEAVLKAGHIPAGMELFKSGSETQLKIIKEWIDASDIFMLILGGRYGSIEPISQKSYTQCEYEYALEKNIPLFSIVIKREALDNKIKKFGKDALELENQLKYKEFKNIVESKHCSFFMDLKDIKYIISDTIHYFEDKYEFTGWVSGKDIIPIQNELKLLKLKVKQQEDELNQLRISNEVFNVTNSDIKNNTDKYKLGQVANYRGLDICVNKIEYKSDGFRIYFYVNNNTNEKIDSFGSFTFKLEQEMYEEEINGLGYGIHPYLQSQYLYPKESFNGYYEWTTNRKVKITELAYHIIKSGIRYENAGIWIV